MDDFKDLAELGIKDDEPQSAFNVAANHVQTLAAKLCNEELLQLYGLYKQGLEGDCNTTKPSWFDFRAKSKWETWNNLRNMPQADAKQKYIELVHKLDPDFTNQLSSAHPSAKEGWVTVSTLQKQCDSDDEDDEDEELMVLVKAGDVDAVDLLINEPNSKYDREFDWDKLDKDGMAYIHWATDRDCTKIITLLVQRGADVAARDAEGQTALHYASSCGHVECVELLLQLGADPTLKDNDGLSALDAAIDDAVRKLLTTNCE